MLFYSLLIVSISLTGLLYRLAIANAKTAKIVFCLHCFVVLGGLSAFRYNVGFDYSYIYRPMFETIMADPFAPFSQSPHEIGFVFLEKAVAIFSTNYQSIFVVTSFLIVGLVMLYYYLYSPNVVVSVFLFLALSQFYCSMNFIRQTLAAVICLYAIPHIQKRKFWRYCGIVCIACLFHISALIMIAFYFINLIPINFRTLSVYIPLVAILYMNSTGVLSLALEYIYTYYNMENPLVATGFSLGYLVCGVCLFLFLLVFKSSVTQLEKSNYIYINYAFFAAVFLLFGTRHGILDRFSLYFDLAIPVGFAIVITDLKSRCTPFKQQNKKNIATLAAALLLTFGGGLLIHTYALSKDGHGVMPYMVTFDLPNNSDLEQPE